METKSFNFRLEKQRNGVVFINENIKTPYNSLSTKEMLEYFEVEKISKIKAIEIKPLSKLEKLKNVIRIAFLL